MNVNDFNMITHHLEGIPVITDNFSTCSSIPPMPQNCQNISKMEDTLPCFRKNNKVMEWGWFYMFSFKTLQAVGN